MGNRNLTTKDTKGTKGGKSEDRVLPFVILEATAETGERRVPGRSFALC